MSGRIEEIRRRFEADTANHALDVVSEFDVYRHLSFGPPGSRRLRVDVVTWPGYLACTGDMGAFVFERSHDMLRFFRGQRVNPKYWGEKVRAASPGGVTEWSREKFEECAKEALEEFIADNADYDEDEVWFLRANFADEVLRGLDEKGRAAAYQAMMEFEYGSDRPFEHFWEVDTDIYTHRFLWCCHAISRMAELYDARAKEKATERER